MTAAPAVEPVAVIVVAGLVGEDVVVVVAAAVVVAVDEGVTVLSVPSEGTRMIVSVISVGCHAVVKHDVKGQSYN